MGRDWTSAWMLGNTPIEWGGGCVRRPPCLVPVEKSRDDDRLDDPNGPLLRMVHPLT